MKLNHVNSPCHDNNYLIALMNNKRYFAALLHKCSVPGIIMIGFIFRRHILTDCRDFAFILQRFYVTTI